MKKLQKGFTLIELIVVFTLISVIGGVGFAAFTSYSKQQDVEQTRLTLRQFIEKARYNTLSSVKPKEQTINSPCSSANPCWKCAILQGYEVDFTNPNAPAMRPLCVYTNAEKVADTTLSISSQYLITSTCTKYVFKVLSNNIECQGGGSFPATISINRYGMQKNITINPTDGIQIP